MVELGIETLVLLTTETVRMHRITRVSTINYQLLWKSHAMNFGDDFLGGKSYDDNFSECVCMHSFSGLYRIILVSHVQMHLVALVRVLLALGSYTLSFDSGKAYR